MEEQNFDRIYLPSVENGLNLTDYLSQYIEREFPKNVVYSIPKDFKRIGEKQANLAEKIVFERLKGFQNDKKELWMIFFHNISYAGKSNRNKRVGKFIIREHDFVLFIKYKEKLSVVLIEVKSNNDGNTQIENVTKISDSKEIKNNKRSAQHQLRDHFEIIETLLGDSANIQKYIFWPFLGSTTKDPQHNLIQRWREEKNIHLFEDTILKQEMFNEWFEKNILVGPTVDGDKFSKLLNRFLILSCGILVDEIRTNMLALLTQEQHNLLNSQICQEKGKPLIVYGAAGTGKTLLIIKKLEQLYKTGNLNNEDRALYICYWPGIRSDVRQKLRTLGIDDYVDMAAFYITQTDFLKRSRNKYKHIFMDEAEVVYLCPPKIAVEKLESIIKRYEAGNKDENNHRGECWFLLDTNQASIYQINPSILLFNNPDIILTKVMRATKNIFSVYEQFYSRPTLCDISLKIGHNVIGPNVFWVDIYKNTRAELIIDLCGSKGFKPNDICIFSFVTKVTSSFNQVNEELAQYFVEDGFRPRCTDDIENFISNKKIEDLLVVWGLRTKGLEFKVVILVIDKDDLDYEDEADRKNMYIMMSRCSCMLIVLCPEFYKKPIDPKGIFRNYSFGETNKKIL